MKKLISLLACVGLAAALLVGCGGSSSSTASKEYNLKDVADAIEQANPLSSSVDLDDFALEYDLNLTMDNVAEYVGKKSNANGDSGLILVVKANAGKASDVASQLETYKQNMVDYYGGYPEFAAAQAQIKDGRVVTRGDYVVLVFANIDGATYDAIDKAVDAALS